MYSTQITEFVKNLKKPKEPLRIDLVLEGGAFNGSYEYGVLLLLKELEKENHIKVHRISGASIGSILGLCYAMDKLYLYHECFNIIQTSFKESGNLSKCKELIQREVDSCSDEMFKNIATDKLYITYYNVTQKQQIVQSSFTSKEDLTQGIVKSCYIPFLFDTASSFESDNINYIDGGQPFIFSNRCDDDCKILYISINQLSRLKNMLSFKGEKNHDNRVLEGLLDAMQFFSYNKKTEFCSYVNQWNIIDYTLIRLKQLLLLIMVYLVNIFLKLINLIYPLIKDTVIYSMVRSVLFKYVNDIVILYCF